MPKSVLFSKLFTGSITLSDTQTIARQLLLKRTFVLDSEGKEELHIETTTLDGKQILLTLKSLPNLGERHFDTFNEDIASEIIQMYCTRTLEEINEMQDIDFQVTGVNYD